jgi:hypothetical protein
MGATRVDIARATVAAFNRAPVQRSSLMEAAAEQRASVSVLEALAGLPEDKRFSTLSDLWPYLPDMAVGM